MSGVNRLINNANTLAGNSQTALKEKLMDGNATATQIEEIGTKMKYKADTDQGKGSKLTVKPK